MNIYSWSLLLLIFYNFDPQCFCYTLTFPDNEVELEFEEQPRSERDERVSSRIKHRPDNHDYNYKEAKGWNYVDTSKGWTPHEKTISFQVLDDPPYYQGSPSWENNEYYSGYKQYPYNHPFRNGSNTGNQNDPNVNYEWQRLPQLGSVYSGAGHYAFSPSTSYYSGYPYNNNPSPTHKPITDSTTGTKLEGTDAQGTTTVSETTDKRQHVPFYYQPYEYIKRKRFRMAVHPGLIAAPLAGLAAYGAVSAFTSKPLLLELGLVDSKPVNEGHSFGGGVFGGGGGGYGGGVGGYGGGVGGYGGGVGGYGGGVGGYGGYGGYRPQYPAYPQYPIAQQPSYYPAPVSPISPGISGPVPQYPILRPGHRPESEKSSWWNPFSALTPRL